MEYHDLRQKFVEMSGRYDLVNATWEDNGADFFINAGQRFLDRVSTYGKGAAKNVQPIAAGTIIVKSANLRAVNNVWAGNSTDGLVKLTKYSLSELKEYYETQLSSVTQGTPAYWAPAYLRPYPDTQTAAGWAGYYNIDDLVLDDAHYTYNGVIIAPPPDETYYISIEGKFYSPTLSATLAGGLWTQTKSYWTEVHPDILLEAALFKLETFYRNTEGAKDWKAGLTEDITGMDFDIVEESLRDSMEMDG